MPAAISISDKAAIQVKALLAQRETPAEGVRVGIRTRGCNGMSYTSNMLMRCQNLMKWLKIKA